MSDLITIDDEILNLKELNKYIICSSNEIRTYFSDKDPFVDLVVTSPPYWDAKDYGGTPDQTGYNQTYEKYLKDIFNTFKGVYDISKKTATLYLIVDTIKRDNNVIRLPDEIARVLEEIGWNHQDTIIWNKVKTLPWSRKGQMRNTYEYILMFTKSKTSYKYNIEEIRVIEPKEWWVNYPERYNPEGTVPSNIWDYPIPAQGSWGSKSNAIEKEFKHACPIPPEMLARIIKLSSDEGDVVLDPYAGTGTLLATAFNLNRKYLGFDVNVEYKSVFEEATLALVSNRWDEIEAYYTFQKHLIRIFNDSIIKLRQLKYINKLIHKLSKEKTFENYSILAGIAISKPLTDPIEQKHTIGNTDYYIICKPNADMNLISSNINMFIPKKPFSTYGITSYIKVITYNDIVELEQQLKYPLYSYINGITSNFNERIESIDVLHKTISIHLENPQNSQTKKTFHPTIFSNIFINKEHYQIILDEVTKDYVKTKYIPLLKKYNLR
jgi:DNA modification methylase